VAAKLGSETPEKPAGRPVGRAKPTKNNSAPGGDRTPNLGPVNESERRNFSAIWSGLF